MDKAWRILSYWTAFIVFFSGMNSVTAHAAEKMSPQVFTQKMDQAVKNPRFSGCQVIHVLISPRDLQDLEFLVSSSSHIELLRLAKQKNQRTGEERVIFRLQSLLWAPREAAFREDYRELRKIESLQVIHCENQNSPARHASKSK